MDTINSQKSQELFKELFKEFLLNKLELEKLKSQELIPDGFTFRSVKILNFSYIVLIQFFPALICAHIFDIIFYDRTKEEYEKISTLQIFIELWIHFWSILVLYYLFRNIIEYIPSPFENLFNSGFKNKLVKETHNGTIFSIVFILFQTSLREKVRIFKDRFFK
jgi:hypothetical protein